MEVDEADDMEVDEADDMEEDDAEETDPNEPAPHPRLGIPIPTGRKRQKHSEVANNPLQERGAGRPRRMRHLQVVNGPMQIRASGLSTRNKTGSAKGKDRFAETGGGNVCQ